MPDRAARIIAFLAATPWAGAGRAPLAGDASPRRYERLRDPESGATAVLMDAPPGPGQDVRPFERLAHHLRDMGLSAPEILASDAEAGLLLIEDLGDALFIRRTAEAPEQEETLYRAAADVLVELQRHPAPALETPTPQQLAVMTGLAFTHYAAAITGSCDDMVMERFQSRFADILGEVLSVAPVLALRDYHAENLLWLEQRAGTARVGLLDFQDAILTHPAYDLVSLLQDARRDVSPAIEQATIAHYTARTGSDPQRLATACAVLGVQRNLRILGVFARLARERGKPRYLDLLPRVWKHLARGLDHPALAGVADTLWREIPQPTPEAVAKLSRRP